MTKLVKQTALWSRVRPVWRLVSRTRAEDGNLVPIWGEP